MTDDQRTTAVGRQQPAEATHEHGEPARDRPDLRGLRGNQEVEEIDVERGRDKVERIVGW